MRNLRKVGVGGGAALLAAALIIPSTGALAQTSTVDQNEFGAASSAEVLDLHLLGRHLTVGQASVDSTLDTVRHLISADAKGVATMLVPAASSVARFGDPAAQGGKACAAGLDQVTGLLNTAGLPIVGGLLPQLTLDLGCGTAEVGGDPEKGIVFAESTGGLVQIRLAMPEVLKSLVGTVQGLIGDLGTGGAIAGLPVVGGLLGDVVPSGVAEGDVLAATDAINGLLGSLTGVTDQLPVAGGAASGVTDTVTGLLNLDSLAGGLNPTATVSDLLSGLAEGDLIAVNLGVASAYHAGDPASYLSRAISEGGSIELLPGFGKDAAGNPAALLKIEIAASKAEVSMAGADAEPQANAENTLIRISSPLIPDLSNITNLLSGVPVVGGLLGSSGIASTDALAGVVNGLVGGVPVVGNLLGFDATVKQLGLNAGKGYVEVAPGMSVSLFCDGIAPILCTEISVGAAQDAVKMPNGRTRIESSAASVHLLKGLNDLNVAGINLGQLLPGDLKLGSILGNGLLGGVLDPILGAAGLSIGEPSDVPGIKISLAHAMAEAGGTRVLGAAEEKARELAPAEVTPPAPAPALPRTGGLPIDATAIPVLLGASAGLRMLVRRRRSA